MPTGKGNDLEVAVFLILKQLQSSHPNHVRFVHQPAITLETNRKRRPDFDLQIKLPQETLGYFIEVQDRKRSENDIVHKIHYIRAKTGRTTFIFVYRHRLSAGIAAELEDAGVMIYNLQEFKAYIGKYSETLMLLHPVTRIDGARDNAMLVDGPTTYTYQACTECTGTVDDGPIRDLYFKQIVKLFPKNEISSGWLAACTQCGAEFLAKRHPFNNHIYVSLAWYVEIRPTRDAITLTFHELKPQPIPDCSTKPQ